jgi:seryl-tRNA synthetase
MIATSEHPLTARFMNEILNKKDLPIRNTGFSTNFRKEAGAHGKDTKGIFRVHQFNKVEQIVLCEPKDSWKIHEELIKNIEGFFKLLKIPFRIVNICSGDLGTVAAKKYDLEAWMPVQNTYREMGSCSNCTDYQARRLNIKFRDKPGEASRDFIHTLNSTLVTDRALVAILENYQQKNRNVKIPKVLWKYTGFKEIKH